MKELEAIKARAEAATEGPWSVRHDHFEAGPGPDDEAQDWYLVEGADAVEHWAHHDEATTEFIARARTDIPKLIAALQAVLDLANHEPRFRPRMFDGEPFPNQVAADEIIKAITEALA